MSEALNCFTYLLENVPLWIKSLEGLESKMRNRPDESSRVSIPVSPQMRRTGSNESIRPSQVDVECSAGVGITSITQLDDVVPAQTPEQKFVAKRKRKTASVLTTASMPSKYRSRSSVIVYYDSAVQEAFEQQVRNIAVGQSYIRKARMEARMEALTRASAPGIDGEDINIRLPARTARTAATFGSATDACTLTSQALDKAQNLCEQGAHQFLREGDCDVEISGAKKSFEEVIRRSEEEIARLKALEEKRKKVKEEERQEAQDRQQRKSMDSHPGLMKSGGIHIEADDDEGEEEDDEDDDGESDDLANLSLPPFRPMART